MIKFKKVKLFKSYNLKSWSFRHDCSAISRYNSYNWSTDNFKIKKKRKATCFKIYNSAIKRTKQAS